MPAKPTEQRRGARAEAARTRGPGASEPDEPEHANGAPRGSALIDLAFVRSLIAAVDESGIDSLEIIRAGTRIRISKSPPPAPAAPAPAPPAATGHAVAGSTVEIAPQPSAPAGPAAAAEDERRANWIDVKSPMVGTFYRAPAPEAPPYVEVGSHVGKGSTLCILEAMKLMNELESEVDGVVREILVENADPVEYGQVLFRIEAAGSAA